MRPLHTDARALSRQSCSTLGNIQCFYYNLQRPKALAVTFHGIEASSHLAANVLFAEDREQFASRLLRLAVCLQVKSTSQGVELSGDSSMHARLEDGNAEELLV